VGLGPLRAQMTAARALVRSSTELLGGKANPHVAELFRYDSRHERGGARLQIGAFGGKRKIHGHRFEPRPAAAKIVLELMPEKTRLASHLRMLRLF